MLNPSEHSRNVIFTHVMRDLDPSFLLVQTKIIAASIVGGLLSLMICGQFGIGLTPMAKSFSHTVHSTMDPFACAAICGGLYAVFPIFFLRLMTPPLQFKAITNRRKLSLLFWFIGIGAIIAYLGHHGDDVLPFSVWVLAALLTSHILAKLLYVLLPSWSWRQREIGNPV